MAKRNSRRPGTGPSKSEQETIRKSSGKAPRPKIDLGAVPVEPEAGNGVGPSEGFQDTSAPLLNQEGLPFDPNRDPMGSATTAPTGFELLREESGAKTRDRAPTVTEGLSEPKPENTRTPGEAAAALSAGDVNVSGTTGMSERHTAAIAQNDRAEKIASIKSSIQDFADMFEGYEDISPEDKENAKRVLQERRADAEATAKSTGLGRSGIINGILNGYGKYRENKEGIGGQKVAKGSRKALVNVALRSETAEQAKDEDAINAEMNRSKGRHDTTAMGPGALPKEEKDRSVTPYAIKNFRTYLDGRFTDFQNRRTYVKRLYERLGLEAAVRNHGAKADGTGLSQCGSADCVRNQKQILDNARLQNTSPQQLKAQIQDNFVAHHTDEAFMAMKKMAEIGHEEHGTRYDDGALATNQPTHTEAECPHILEDGSRGIVTDPHTGIQHTCNNHITPDRVNPLTGKPVVSDWHEAPLGLTYTSKLADGSTGTVHVPAPHLGDFLKCPAYVEPGGIEDQINAVSLLNAHANLPENRKEFGDFMGARENRALTRSKMLDAVKEVLGSASAFTRKVVNRKVGVYSETTFKSPYSDRAAKVRIGTKVEPLQSIIDTGARNFRRPGDEFGDSFRVAGLPSDTKSMVGALVDLGLKHFKTQKDMPNDVADILENSPRAQERMERAQSRGASVKTGWERIANAVLGAHKQAEAAKIVSLSQAQEGRKRTPGQAGFVSEGRERGPSSSERTQDLLSDNMVEQGNQIAEIAGTVTGDTRTFVPLAATGGNRGSGVAGGMPIDQPRRDPETVEEEPEAPLSEYSTTSAPQAPAPTVKTPEETEADIAAYAAKKKAQRKASRNTPPDATLQ
jgi:hypothetical protein